MTWEQFRALLNRKGWRVSTWDSEPRCPRHTYGPPKDFAPISPDMEVQFKCANGKWFAVCHNDGCFRTLMPRKEVA